jgi:diamine N-acetyltransferase
MKMAEIKYMETGLEGLDLIEPLWLKLNDHHKARSSHFSGHFEHMTFEERKLKLLEKAQRGELHIDFAVITDTGKPAGYCVATICEGQGEVDSIYVEEEYRHSGMGDALMKKAMSWMDKLAITDRKIEVSSGNEEVIKFYSRYNFYPRKTVLEQKH